MEGDFTSIRGLSYMDEIDDEECRTHLRQMQIQNLQPIASTRRDVAIHFEYDNSPVSILHKSIAGRYFIENASWE